MPDYYKYKGRNKEREPRITNGMNGLMDELMDAGRVVSFRT